VKGSGYEVVFGTDP